ncbi:MAG TPA: enoyl-CoA hydratase/isomerase family protein [Bradyrhizobium sp.]
MPNYSYDLLRVEVADGVARATIDHPPINLLDLRLMGELDRLETELRADDAVRIVIFDSANPDFFLAHYDIADLISRCGPPPAPAVTLKRFHAMLERYRLMPKVTIALLEGAARGGGSEFALALDMRFAAIDRAILGQPEVALGLIPGGGGTQHLARLAGRARALEIIVGCEAFDALAAERYGWVNRALPADKLRPFVTRLGQRIASFPAAAIARAKLAVDAALPQMHHGLMEEAQLFSASLADPASEQRMRAYMAAGGQSKEIELRFEEALDAAVSSLR